MRVTSLGARRRSASEGRPRLSLAVLPRVQPAPEVFRGRVVTCTHYWVLKNRQTGIIVATFPDEHSAWVEKDRRDEFWKDVQPPEKSPLVVEAVER